MYKKLLFALLLFIHAGANAQKVIQLYNGAAPGSEKWTYNEKSINTPGAEIVYNVSHPTLTVYRPASDISTGTAMVVCPGGGFYILAMDREGKDVTSYLLKKGITVFLLKYRLGQSFTANPARELTESLTKGSFVEKIAPLIPLSVADGREAIKYVRAHAAEYHISPSRIGIMGFSAGGTVAASSAYNYTAANRPDFVAPIYAYMPPNLEGTIPADAPPMFLAAASDDDLGLAPHSVDLYSKWQVSKHAVELHMYQKGGHGFGMRKQNIPTDTWIDRFADWLKLNGF